MSNRNVYYISGPMSGYPQFNVPHFRRAAQVARRAAIQVVSPVELDGAVVESACLESPDGVLVDGKICGATWGDLLSRDVKVIADEAQGILLLEGWWRSRGARLEVFTALLCKHEFLQYYDDVECICALTSDVVRDQLREFMP